MPRTVTVDAESGSVFLRRDGENIPHECSSVRANSCDAQERSFIERASSKAAAVGRWHARLRLLVLGLRSARLERHDWSAVGDGCEFPLVGARGSAWPERVEADGSAGAAGVGPAFFAAASTAAQNPPISSLVRFFRVACAGLLLSLIHI